jgi:hypothetical protein
MQRQADLLKKQPTASALKEAVLVSTSGYGLQEDFYYRVDSVFL